MSKPFRVEHADILWPTMTVLGIATVAISAYELMGAEGSLLGGWSFYTLIIGVFFSVWGLWELVVHVKRMRKMRDFLAMEGKAHLIRNMEEMEYLAWCLPAKWEAALKEKKKAYRVK